jgi:glycosyltransferase involved in cell wall biosynthesis
VHRYVADRDILVRPHAQSAAKVRGRSPKRSEGGRLRVAIIGAIGAHKGSAVLVEVARDALIRRLPIDYVIVGYTDRDSEFRKLANVRMTGSYSEDKVQDILASEAPHLAFLPSVWPETFCYTLSIALAAGLPVAVFDLGAQSERLSRLKGGRSIIMPVALAKQPDKINDLLLSEAERLGAESEPAELDIPSTRYTFASYYGLEL